MTWPLLDCASVAGALRGYASLGDVRRMVWHSSRPFAASGIVECARGSVFVKRHDARVRDVADLAEEHAFIAYLRAGGCAVPVVLADCKGATAVAGADGIYEVHALAFGEDRYRDAPSWTPLADLDEARQAGVALARLHCAAVGFDAPVRRTRLVVAGDWLWRARDPRAALEVWAAGDDALAGRAWREDFSRVLRPFYDVTRREAPALWVHGDLHASNLLWQGGLVSSVLDFGLCNRASAVFDLATAIERNAVAWLEMGSRDIGHAAIACGLIEGYAAVAAVPDGLAAILPVVHVEFALSELSYFHSVTRDAASAEMAYADFLLGHAVWFAGSQGQRFLAQLG